MFFINKANNIQPWRFPIWNQSVVPCLVLTVKSWPAYRSLRRQVRWFGIPISLRTFQFVVIHTVNRFNLVNETEVDVFLEFPCFYYDLTDVGNLISGSSAFSKSSVYIWSSWFTYCWSLAWRILSTALLAGESAQLYGSWGLPGGSVDKDSACNAGELDLIPRSGRPPGEGNGNPLQYSCLENSMDKVTWRATVHGVAKSWTQLSD